MSIKRLELVCTVLQKVQNKPKEKCSVTCDLAPVITKGLHIHLEITRICNAAFGSPIATTVARVCPVFILYLKIPWAFPKRAMFPDFIIKIHKNNNMTFISL